MSALPNVPSDNPNSSTANLEESIFSAKFSEENKFVKILNKNSGLTVEGECMLEGEFESLFPLFKGLSGLGKPKFLKLDYSFDRKSISFSFASTHGKAVYLYFQSLLHLLQKESKFRKVWAELISNRNRFNAEQKILQTTLLD